MAFFFAERRGAANGADAAVRRDGPDRHDGVRIVAVHAEAAEAAGAIGGGAAVGNRWAAIMD